MSDGVVSQWCVRPWWCLAVLCLLTRGRHTGGGVASTSHHTKLYTTQTCPISLHISHITALLSPSTFWQLTERPVTDTSLARLSWPHITFVSAMAKLIEPSWLTRPNWDRGEWWPALAPLLDEDNPIEIEVPCWPVMTSMCWPLQARRRLVGC